MNGKRCEHGNILRRHCHRIRHPSGGRQDHQLQMASPCLPAAGPPLPISSLPHRRRISCVMHPVAAFRQSEVVRVRFHVPVPPLAWGMPFAGQRPVSPRDGGFTLVDDAGVVPITGATIEDDATVAIAMGRPAGAGLRVRYADYSRFAGVGGLHDSDPALADDAYAYAPEVGHQPQAEVAGWVGRRYPLVNWCVGFNRAVDG